MHDDAASRRSWLTDLSRDLPYVFRTLRRSPGFAALAVGTLALGVGANAAIFSVVNAVLLRPLPFAQPERLVRVYEGYKDKPEWTGSVSIPNLNDWREQSRTIQGFVAYTGSGRNLQTSGESIRLSATEVSANAFSVLGVPPLVGRGFVTGEDEPGNNQVVVLSEAFWRRQLGADAQIVGRTLPLDGVPHTIVGVMPSSFIFPAGRTPPDIWVPYTVEGDQLHQRGNHSTTVVARLGRNATFEQAQAEMRSIADHLAEQYPDNMTNRTVVLVPLRDDVVGRIRPALLTLLGAVGLVLLIACANVANLLLARAAVRRKDIALRLAIGATRGQLIRQHLTESVVLALAGTVIGTIAAMWGVQGLARLANRVLPVTSRIPLDGSVFVFLLIVSMGSALLFGLAPALQLSSARLSEELVGAGGKTTLSGAQRRSRSVLVVAQIALSLVLLVGAGLLMRTFFVLRNTEAGIVTEGALTARLSLTSDNYGKTAAERAVRLYAPALEQVRRIPGVKAAGFTSLLPIESWGTNGSYWIDGQPEPQSGHEPIVELRQVSTGYFEALGVPLKLGRELGENDGTVKPEPVMVNEAFVRKNFPEGSPLGRMIRRGHDADEMFVIVGVVGDVRQAGLDREPVPEMYFGYRSSTAGWWLPSLVVRTDARDPNIPALTTAIRKAVASVAPDIPLYSVRTMDEVIGNSLAARRLNVSLLAIFASVALLLAISGIYGVMSHLVAQRTREVGIRMALGADGRDVVWLMLRYAIGLAVLGIVIGALGAMALTRLIVGLLFGVGARDPATFVVVAAILAIVAVVASWVPARRAARVEPLIALRSE